MKLALVGRGRMGKAIAGLARDRGWEITCMCGTDAALDRRGIERADVVMEFTRPDSAVPNVEQIVSLKKDLVVGTTGWLDRLDYVRDLVERAGTGLIYGANFSVGMNLLFQLSRHAGGLFAGHEFAPFVFEAHHAGKKDASSGSARELEAELRKGLGGTAAIPVSSLRAGSFPGIHEVGFDAVFETVTLKHEVRDRRVFAEGALVAARWIHGKKGMFTFSEMLESQ